mmetsp:Transcript_37679/g.52177  ORF Transcript_37679/g.52177 Transcript_37679/m.52177 type:complete len:91 (+) Transcript_37679:877-1149(+)
MVTYQEGSHTRQLLLLLQFAPLCLQHLTRPSAWSYVMSIVAVAAIVGIAVGAAVVVVVEVSAVRGLKVTFEDLKGMVGEDEQADDLSFEK